MNYLDFIISKKENNENIKLFNESFKTKDIDKVHDLLLKLFKKKLGLTILYCDFNTIIDNKKMKSFFFINYDEDNKPKGAWSLNYLISDNSSEVYSINFYNSKTTEIILWGDENTVKSDLSIYTLGSSVAYFVPIICHVILNNDYELKEKDAKIISNDIFKESYIYNYGKVKFNIYENLAYDIIDDLYHLNLGYINEVSQAQEYRWKKKIERDEAFKHRSESALGKQNYERIQQEYVDIVNAIRGGAQTIDDIKMALKKNEPVKIEQDKSINQCQNELNTEGKNPNQAFKEMSVYVKTVINGMQPGAIICGAPGIGKTYRIMKQLKAAGYNDGHNMYVIKGKCTTRALYNTLYEYKDKGKIVVIDDADSLVGPKAVEDTINILKAVLDNADTVDGRKVTYKIAGKLTDDDGNDVPKMFYYKGGIIVITNYSAGQLDSALKGRTFIQSLDFSTKQLLSIIEDLIPNIEPTRLTDKSKKKALEYLKELSNNGSEMEISIRTFATCARLFTVCEDDPDMSDNDVKSMIKEQMENQFAKGGEKY